MRSHEWGSPDGIGALKELTQANGLSVRAQRSSHVRTRQGGRPPPQQPRLLAPDLQLPAPQTVSNKPLLCGPPTPPPPGHGIVTTAQAGEDGWGRIKTLKVTPPPPAAAAIR